jgi:hypothetical protein
MKFATWNLFVLAGFFTFLAAPFSTASAQGTAFTYQGRLNNNGAPASGTYNIQFTLYTSSGGEIVAAGPLTNSAVAVTNGLFTTTIDFGPGVFTGAAYWLDLAVCTNGSTTFTELAPRQPLTATPYAVMANSASNLLGVLPTAQLSGTIPSSNFSGTYGNAVSFDNGADSFDGTFIGQFVGSSFLGGSFNGQFFGSGTGLINLNASQLTTGTVPLSQLPSNIALLNSNQTFTAQNIFMQNVGIGNANPSPFYQIDMSAPQSNVRMVSTNAGNGAVLELRNLSSYPYEYIGAINFNDTNNLYAGQIGYIAENPTNELFDYFEFRVGGSVGLTIEADPRGEQAASLIGGSPANTIASGSAGNAIVGGGFPGFGNTIYSNSFGIFIGAGSGNQIGPNVNDSLIVGGYGNTVQSYDSVIVGGEANTIPTNSGDSFIGGGLINTNGGSYSFIGGGYDNGIGSGGGNFVGGGYYNEIQTNSQNDVIGGGFGNIIEPYATYSVIAGGEANTIVGDSNYWATGYVVGSTIGGGAGNVIQTNSPYATIAGGIQNIINSNANWSAIGGGVGNQILSNAEDGVIGGGSYNMVGASGGVVPGGYGNLAGGIQSFAAGTQAQATNNGAFVLADDEITNFYSTTSNQLSARFTGGIRFVTAGTGMTLDGQPILSGNNGTGLTNVNAITLNGSSSSAFAPASSSTNYIQNQTATQQAAGFSINGNATVGGTVTANSLTITNQFRIAGAGVGTSTAAFIQVATVTNSVGDSTYINNPLCNNDPNAILIVTHNYSPPGLGSIVNNHPVGVWYPGNGEWAIYNEDLANMQTNPAAAFNVLIIKH